MKSLCLETIPSLSLDKIILLSTSTQRNANTSATAASSGYDLNGMSLKLALVKLKKRLIHFFLSLILPDQFPLSHLTENELDQKELSDKILS